MQEGGGGPTSHDGMGVHLQLKVGREWTDPRVEERSGGYLSGSGDNVTIC